jgi:hypothetical protein
MHARDAHSASHGWRSHDHLRAPSAHADQRHTPRYRHTTHTRASGHTRRDKHHPAQRHVSVTTHLTRNSAHQQAMHATSHTWTQHTNTQVPHPSTSSHTAATTAQCATITACSPPRARLTCSTAQSSALPTRCPQNITRSHTRGLRATLTAELSGCSASTGCCRRVGCCSTATRCKTHDQPSRHTTGPDAAADPASHPQSNAKQSHAALHSLTAATARRGAATAHATTQIHNRNTTVQHPTHCARDSAGKARPKRAIYIGRMTQPRCFTFSQA